MSSVLCGKPTPGGAPCRRPISAPGVPCGAAHPDQAAVGAVAVVVTAAPGPGADPFADTTDPPAAAGPAGWDGLAGDLAAAGVPADRVSLIVELVEREARAAAAGEPSPAAADREILDRFERWYCGSEQDEEWSLDFNFSVTETMAEDLARTGRDSGWSKASPGTLRRLWEAGEEDGETVAAHPNCPPDLLAEFAASDDWWVRATVAENPSASHVVLRALAVDAHEGVREAARANPSCPELTDAEIAHAGLLTD